MQLYAFKLSPLALLWRTLQRQIDTSEWDRSQLLPNRIPQNCVCHNNYRPFQNVRQCEHVHTFQRLVNLILLRARLRR